MKMLSKHFTTDLPYGKSFQKHLLHAQSRQAMLDWVDRYFERLGRLESGEPEAFADSDFLVIPTAPGKKSRSKPSSLIAAKAANP